MRNNKWLLPKSLRVGDISFPIRSDFRNGLDCMMALQDDELTDFDKVMVVVRIIFPDWQNIREAGLFQQAAVAAMEFLNRGKIAHKENGGGGSGSLIRWEQDIPMIFDAINKSRDTDIREAEYMHWWTFCGKMSEIGESLFATVISLRSKIKKHKKRSKSEQEFIRDNAEYFVSKDEDISTHDDDLDFYASLVRKKETNE